MKRRNATLWALALLLALPTCGSNATTQRKKTPLKPYSWAYEVQQLNRVDELPTYRSGLVEQLSSYDPTGGNQDGFSGQYSYIHKEGNNLVLADLKGPGVIERIWTPTPTDDMMEFYIDGEKTPRLRIRFSDLFSGKVYPFVHPLCANQVGGYYCYVPIPYAKSCKVVFCGPRIMFHQIEHRDLTGYDVKSYTGTFTAEEKAALDDACRAWNDLTPSCPEYAVGRSAGAQLVEKHFTLMPGQETTFFEQNTGGRIAGFEIDGGSAFEGLNKDVVLNATWDDDTRPAIHAPVADFFGYAFGKKSMRGILIGCRGDNVNYCYLPAPFDSHAVMRLNYLKRDGVYQAPIQVTTRVWANRQARDAATEGRFYTNWRREIQPKTGEYYKFLSHKGRGHYVGTIQLAQGFRPEMTLFFEGDDSVYVDGKMRMHGTGSEDSYNGGWYAMLDRWDRGVSLPIHGSLDYSLQMARTGGYRFYLTDKLSFNQELYIGIEHGGEGNTYPVDYASVAFFYSDTPSEECMEPTQALRTVWQPDKHNFFPQLMSLTLGGQTDVRLDRAMLVSSRDIGMVRVALDDVPEGHYHIYLDYYARPDGADFSVWQRQSLIRDWQSSKAEKEEHVAHCYLGDMVLTPQTNTLTFQIRGNDFKQKFEFANIYLEKIKE